VTSLFAKAVNPLFTGGAAFSLFVQHSMLSRKTFSYSVAVLLWLSLFVVLKPPPTLGGRSKHKVLHGFKTLFCVFTLS
jgi:hypothetical protein